MRTKLLALLFLQFYLIPYSYSASDQSSAPSLEQFLDDLRKNPKTRDLMAAAESNVRREQFRWLKKRSPEELPYRSVIDPTCPVSQTDVNEKVEDAIR
jgi:hypothetical protein